MRLEQTSRYWKCSECKSTHETFCKVTGREADRRLVCCSFGFFQMITEEQLEEGEA